MSIATELTRIQQAKADIKTAIEAKGVIVPSSATIDTYDDYVSQISGGGGGGMIRYTSGTPYCNSENLVVNVQNEISVDSGTSWVNSGSPYVVIVESGASQCQTGDVGFICYDSNGSVLTSGDCSSLSNYTINRDIITEYGAVSSYNIYAVEIGACVTTIASYTFKNDNGNMPATSITFDQGSQLTTIEDYAFKDIKGITSISLPNSLTTLGNFAFSYSDNIAGVFTIPANVTSIGTYCFEGLTKVSYFEILATTPPTIGNAPFIGTNCALKVPAASVSAYQSAWSQYSSRIQAIPNS